MMSLDARPYVAARWLRGPHLMTLWGRLVRVPPRLRARRERWELPDGDFIDVDRYEPPVRRRRWAAAARVEDALRTLGFAAPAPSHDGGGRAAPLIVICHGLEGCSRTPYVRGLVSLALSRGLAAVAMNFRSCSGELNRLPRAYHSGDTGDLAHVVERLAAEQPGRAIGLVGFSLGGNVVVKYLGERGDEVPPQVRAAVGISVAFDLVRSARTLDGPGFWNAFYRGRFLQALRTKALAKSRLFPGAFDVAAIRRARTFAEFDEVVTAPLHGFTSALDYWTRASSGPWLGRVRRPLLVLAALDDPLVPGDTVPVEAARHNPWVTLETSPRGGHIAFVSGWPFWPSFWAERRAADFLAGALAPDAPPLATAAPAPGP